MLTININNCFYIESSGGFDLFDRNNDIIKTAKITFDFHFHSLNTNYITFVFEQHKILYFHSKHYILPKFAPT